MESEGRSRQVRSMDLSQVSPPSVGPPPVEGTFERVNLVNAPLLVRRHLQKHPVVQLGLILASSFSVSWRSVRPNALSLAGTF